MLIPVVKTLLSQIILGVRHSPIIKIQQQHIIRVDAQKVVEQEKANNGPGLEGPGLLPHPGPGRTIEIFSPLLSRQLVEMTPVALLQQCFHLPHQQDVGMGVTTLVQQD